MPTVDTGAHVFLGLVGRTPIEVADPELAGARAWYHVHCVMDGPQSPVAVSLTQAGVLAGDRVNPGDYLDLQGSSIWLVGPKDGQSALVSVERRHAPTHRSRSLLGELNTMTSWKATGIGIPLTPGQWSNPWTNILGLGFGLVSVSGRGPAWIGTHVNASHPPPPTPTDLLTTAGLFPIYPGHPPLLLPGNPALFATAYEQGVTLHLLKVAGGRQFGTGLVWPS